MFAACGCAPAASGVREGTRQLAVWTSIALTCMGCLVQTNHQHRARRFYSHVRVASLLTAFMQNIHLRLSRGRFGRRVHFRAAKASCAPRWARPPSCSHCFMVGLAACAPLPAHLLPLRLPPHHTLSPHHHRMPHRYHATSLRTRHLRSTRRARTTYTALPPHLATHTTTTTRTHRLTTGRHHTHRPATRACRLHLTPTYTTLHLPPRLLRHTTPTLRHHHTLHTTLHCTHSRSLQLTSAVAGAAIAGVSQPPLLWNASRAALSARHAPAAFCAGCTGWLCNMPVTCRCARLPFAGFALTPASFHYKHGLLHGNTAGVRWGLVAFLFAVTPLLQHSPWRRAFLFVRHTAFPTTFTAIPDALRAARYVCRQPPGPRFGVPAGYTGYILSERHTACHYALHTHCSSCTALLATHFACSAMLRCTHCGAQRHCHLTA